MKSHRLSGFFDTESRRSPHHSTTSQMSGNGCTMDAVPLGKLTDRRASEVILGKLGHLDRREKSLKIPNSPHHLAPRVLNRRALGPLWDTVHTSFPPRDKGLQPWGEVRKKVRQGP